MKRSNDAVPITAFLQILYCNIMVILTRSNFNQCKELLEFAE